MIARVDHGVMRILAGTGRYRYESGGLKIGTEGYCEFGIAAGGGVYVPRFRRYGVK